MRKHLMSGLARGWLILRTADPEPVEFLNLALLIVSAFTYIPLASAPDLSTPQLLAFQGIGWSSLLVAFVACKVILWFPCSPLRIATLVLKVMLWTLIGTNLISEFGLSTRGLLCAVLALSSVWAAYRVAAQGH